MKKSAAIRVMALIALAFLFFLGSSAIHRCFRNERALYRAADTPPPENTSPLMSFTVVALGGFRGVIADLLWIRSIEMQAQGRFFELAQLADWITKLEPHFVRVWAFHAWNMAYNIGNFFPDPEDRWRWIQHGIGLLRDEAIKLNPTQPALFWEIAWLYQHKIGYVMDRSHWYYKARLAAETQKFLDGRADGDVVLDPEKMKAINERYGPLDWRHPSAHALYWAWLGRGLAPPSGAAYSDPAARRAQFNCERAILQSMSQLFRQGRLFIDPESRLYVTSPMFELLPTADATYRDALARFDSITFHISYADFLANAAFILSCYGDVEKARSVFDLLVSHYPSDDAKMNLETFIERTRARDFADLDLDTAMAMVEGSLFQAFLADADGQHAQAKAFEERAERDWNGYMNSRVSEDHRRRTCLPPLNIIRDIARDRARNIITQTQVESGSPGNNGGERGFRNGIPACPSTRPL